MRRRALFVGAASLAIAATLPAVSEAVEVDRVWSSADPTVPIEWFNLVKALGYDKRRQYVANLRAVADRNERLNLIADLIEQMNERPEGFK